jgi:putative nucleotidyltransferase with HDIG domain
LGEISIGPHDNCPATKARRDRRVAFYTGTVCTAAAIATSLLIVTESLSSIGVVLCLAALAALAEQNSIKLSNRTEESVSLLPTIFAAVAFGPLAAALVGAASMVGDLVPRSNSPVQVQRWAVYTSTRTLSGAATGVAAMFCAERVNSALGAIVFATFVATVIANALDLGFGLTAHWLRQVGDPWVFIRTLGPMVLASMTVSMPVIAIVAYSFETFSSWTLPLFLVPALAAHRSFTLYHRQRELTSDLIAVNQRLEQATWSFASALVATVEARDEYTAGHSTSVASYARKIAERMGLTAEERDLAHLAGLVHDVGKVGLPPSLLEKRGPLTLDERRQMELHSEIGERILANIDAYSEISRIVRHHHERIDGQGYPDGLRGSEIPLIARIIAVADAYDAMTSDRPYRDAMPSRVARLRLAQAVESQFDTTVVAAFEAILATERPVPTASESIPLAIAAVAG